METIAHTSIVGRRKTNEDTVDIRVANDHIFLGVYDGHGGPQTSSMLKESMYPCMREHLLSSSIPIAMRETIGVMDDMSERLGHYRCGSTVVVTYIVRGRTSSTIYVGSVGDSAAILVDGSYRKLTTPHNEDDPVERQRVLSLGGTFIDGYVEGTLNMTRAIGDHEIKRFVTSTPDVKKVCASRGSVLVLASDGLTDFVSDNEILTIVSRNRVEDIPDKLSRLAYSNGSSDNISVVAVRL